jgi:hypothetical protein
VPGIVSVALCGLCIGFCCMRRNNNGKRESNEKAASTSNQGTFKQHNVEMVGLIQVTIPTKVKNIGLQIFVTCTFYVFFTFTQFERANFLATILSHFF